MSSSDTAPPPSLVGEPLRRFWCHARGFWRGKTAALAWGLLGLLTVCTVLQLIVQYRLNLWNHDFFNALEQRDGREIWHQTKLLLLFAAMSIGLAVFAVWGRMTFQRRWREWVTRNLIGAWLTGDRYRRLDVVGGQHQNAEYRISEDARVATDAPIDLVVGLLAAVLGAGTFVTVLWNVGGSLDIDLPQWRFHIPGYLVVAAVAYSAMTTLGMMWIGRHMVYVIDRKNQAESELKYAVAHLRESATAVGGRDSAMGFGGSGDLSKTASAVGSALTAVIRQWQRLGGQYMRTTVVSSANTLLAPLVGLILCVPKFIQGELLLGDVIQAAAAFVAVQSSFNWLVDNFPRLAECLSSANRVGVLLGAFDEMERAEGAIASDQSRASLRGQKSPPLCSRL